MNRLLLVLALSSCVPPAPQPTPSPTPTAAPTAFPTPSPAATPPGDACKLPPSTGACVDHPQAEAMYRDQVVQAQAQAAENGFANGGQVISEDAYSTEVARLLRGKGYCAINGRFGGHTSGDEVWIKATNGFSEHWDVVSGAGRVITLFAARCAPAGF